MSTQRSLLHPNLSDATLQSYRARFITHSRLGTKSHVSCGGLFASLPSLLRRELGTERMNMHEHSANFTPETWQKHATNAYHLTRMAHPLLKISEFLAQ